jgi:hypothetical protein
VSKFFFLWKLLLRRELFVGQSWVCESALGGKRYNGYKIFGKSRPHNSPSLCETELHCPRITVETLYLELSERLQR